MLGYKEHGDEKLHARAVLLCLCFYKASCAGMASLVLLLEALVRCHQDDNFSSKERKETNNKNGKSMTKGGIVLATEQHDYSSSFVSEDEDAQNWKIAESCIWP